MPRPIIALLICVFVACSYFAPFAHAAGPLYLDPSQPVDARVKDLIGRLTLEEKATLLDHAGPEVERFHIRADQWNQCLHGVVWDRPTTMFPVSIAMAATWDPALVHDEATAISDEARAIYNLWHQQPDIKVQHKGLIYRAPVINISRNPYWGRINECFGEDPFLTGRIGVAYVKGLQGDDPKYLKLAATLKHFAVNNVEKNRQSLSATVSERMLYEYWLPHWRDCVVEGGAQSVMASYNAINGTPNNMNKSLLTDILKTQWGFQGFVVSDLGGVNTMVTGHEKGKMSYEEAVAKSMIAGCDFSDKEFRTYIPAAVRQGLLPESRLDDALLRVLRVRFRLGEFDPPKDVPFSTISPDVICSEAHRNLSLKAAREAIVLLKNDDHLLPLDRTMLKSIAVVGPHGNRFTAGGYSGKAQDPVTPLAGITNRAGAGIEVRFAEGAQIAPPRRTRGKAPPPFDKAAELKKAIDVARIADVAIVCVGTTLDIEAEDRDRTDLGLPGNQQELVEAVRAANPRTIVVELNAGPLTVPWISKNVPAIVEAWWDGQEGGNAIADVLFGDMNPAGRLPLTVYASPEQVPPQDQYDITQGFTYMYLHGDPLFAFGHGLSYTHFTYGRLHLSADHVSPTDTITVSFELTNTGPRDGDEVAQLYVHQEQSRIPRPAKELRGFQRVHLRPSETQTIHFTLPAPKLAFYDVTTHGFVVDPGTFDVMVGSASDDIRQAAKLTVTAPR
ncbi:MAG TPA: glycoside hydrolase family 3 C-terminal domain-containing protein [Tepidisphaeraceae bacterium]